jgi:hypothetical protein
MNLYRVVRENGRIRVLRLDKPDALGNTTWYVVATLNPTDRVEDGRTAAELTDSEIIRAVTE